MYNEDPATEHEDSSKLKRKMEETPRSSRRKLLRRKIQRTVPESEEIHEPNISTFADPEHEFLVNPQSSKILSSHKALELASQSEVPETAYYPSPQGHNFMICMPMGEGMPVAPEFIPLSSPQLPPMDCPEEDLESHQYQEIMQMLVQAIHNQNRIMEECKNILTSIHHAITPATAPTQLQQTPTLPQQPVFNTSTVTHNAQQQQQPAHIMPLWNPTKECQSTEEPQQVTISQQPPQSQKVAESQSKSIPIISTMPKVQSNNSGYKKQSVKSEPREVQPQITSLSLPQPPPINLQSVSSSKEPDKPTAYGLDGEFSSAYLRYVYSKSSTATSFANVLMKEVFTLEERISSNCNGVMGKKALEAERLDKIKRAVKRFYTDSEDEFQDLWKKCRKSIDSTNRNLKFVIMKKPTL